MTFDEFFRLTQSDLYRHTRSKSLKSFLKTLLLVPGFTYTFWFRAATYLSKRSILGMTVGVGARFMLRHLMHKYGIYLPRGTKVGPGFYIGHYGQIVIHEATVMGRNCNVSQGVTIGQTNRGDRRGVPTLGDNIFVAPGAKVIGGIRIGNNVAIGANAVVTTDIPDNAVVVGIPGRVVSSRGSEGYIQNTDY